MAGSLRKNDFYEHNFTKKKSVWLQIDKKIASAIRFRSNCQEHISIIRPTTFELYAFFLRVDSSFSSNCVVGNSYNQAS